MITIDTQLYHSAVEMWIFATYLPLMIGRMVPEDDDMWQCFLLLLDIMKVSTCQIQSPGLAGYLEVLVSDHHHSFVCCYPENSITPKLHYCVHLPDHQVPCVCTGCQAMHTHIQLLIINRHLG